MADGDKSNKRKSTRSSKRRSRMRERTPPFPARTPWRSRYGVGNPKINEYRVKIRRIALEPRQLEG